MFLKTIMISDNIYNGLEIMLEEPFENMGILSYE